MKKLIFNPALISFLFFVQSNAVAQTGVENFKTIGKLSTNNENEDKEPDPAFAGLVINPAVFKKQGQSGNSQQVSQLEKGMRIVTDIIDRMIQSEYSFSLLSSHKYMVNNCLGVKVSSGQFKIKFGNPGIEVSSGGKIKIKLKVDKIKFSALKVRTRPCVNPLHAPDACHFGKKFEIGGEATDLTMTTTLNLVTQSLEGSAGICYFAFGEPFDITWKIGGFNLRPMPNVLDNVGKEMAEDALNHGMTDLLYNKFIEISKQVIPQYYQACEEVYNTEKIKNIGTQASSGVETNNETEKWVVSVNNLKGSTGRILFDNPAGSIWTIYIYAMADEKYITSYAESNNKGTVVLAPGAYKITLNNVPVLNVPVQKSHDTKLKCGTLNVVSEGVWYLYDETGTTSYTSGNKATKMPVPVGTYMLEINGQKQPVVIKNKEMVEM